MILTLKVLLRIFTFVQKRIENTFSGRILEKIPICKRLPKCGPETIYYFFPGSLHISVVSGGQTTVVTQLYNYEKNDVRTLIQRSRFAKLINFWDRIHAKIRMILVRTIFWWPYDGDRFTMLVVKHNVGDFFVLSATF